MPIKVTKSQWAIAIGVGVALPLYLNPNNGVALPLAAVANVLIIVVAFGAAVLEYRRLIARPLICCAFLMVVVAGALSVFGSERSSGDMLYGMRVLSLTPVTMALCGFALVQMGPIATVLTLLPTAVGGVILMTWAMTLPFTGEFLPGVYVWENDRVFLHPLSNLPMWPVSLSENCAVAFVLFFFTFAGLRRWTLMLTIPVAIIGAGISVSSATRTYVYSQFAIFGLVVLRKLTLERRYRDIGIGFVTLLVGFMGLYFYEPLRAATLDRLDRFGTGEGAFGTSGRIDIWAERYPMALQSGWFTGLGTTGYSEKFELSSHNVLLDYWLMGGTFYMIAHLVVLICIFWEVIQKFFSGDTDQFEIAVIGGFSMMAIVTLVSSPVVSSAVAHGLYWFLCGSVLGCAVRRLGTFSKLRSSEGSDVVPRGARVTEIGAGAV